MSLEKAFNVEVVKVHNNTMMVGRVMHTNAMLRFRFMRPLDVRVVVPGEVITISKCLFSLVNMELIPSVVFVAALAVVDGMRHVYMHWHLRPLWSTALFCLLMACVLTHSGVVAWTVLFYINSDWQSSYLSDAERTWLNNALVGFLILDLVLDLYSWFLVFRLHRERRRATPLVPTAVVTQQPAGKTQALLGQSGQSTSLGGSIRVVGLPTTRHVAFDMGGAYKKNK